MIVNRLFGIVHKFMLWAHPCNVVKLRRRNQTWKTSHTTAPIYAGRSQELVGDIVNECGLYRSWRLSYLWLFGANNQYNCCDVILRKLQPWLLTMLEDDTFKQGMVEADGIHTPIIMANEEHSDYIKCEVWHSITSTQDLLTTVTSFQTLT